MNNNNSLYLAIFYLLLTACSITTKRNTVEYGASLSPKTYECDSLFLLSITDVDDTKQENKLLFYLDTLNSRLNVIGQWHQEVNFYRCYSINSKKSIEYDDNMEGHVKLTLRRGLIVERGFKETNVSIRYQYDSLKHLKSIIYVGGQKNLSWDCDCLHRVIYIDSTSNRFNERYNILYDFNYPSNCYSPDLLNSIITNAKSEFLFAYLGLYGRLPLGKDYTIEKINYDYTGGRIKKSTTFKEYYSNDGLLINSSRYQVESKTIQKRSYFWNYSNIRHLSKLL